MSEQSTGPGTSGIGKGPLKTLAVRTGDDMRAQLDIIAQLNDRAPTPTKSGTPDPTAGLGNRC